MPKRVAIITDSTCDMPAELTAEHNIHVVPLYVNFGTETLRDGVDLDADGFFARLQTDPHHPRTSQPTPTDFMEAFHKVRQETDAEEIAVITISEDLSGTYASAIAAQREVDFPVHVLDTRTVSMGLSLAVMAAVEAADQGVGGAEVIEAAHSAAQKIHLFFVVDTLEYLHKGGRIGAASKFIGTALSIKPVLQIKDGVVQPKERVRTKKRALSRLLDLIEENIDLSRPLFVSAGHGNAPEEGDQLVQRLTERFQPEKLYLLTVGAAIGAHAGPGVVGAAFYQP